MNPNPSAIKCEYCGEGKQSVRRWKRGTSRYLCRAHKAVDEKEFAEAARLKAMMLDVVADYRLKQAGFTPLKVEGVE